MPRVLIVASSSALRDAIRCVLTPLAGAEFAEASSAPQALEEIKRVAPDALVADARLHRGLLDSPALIRPDDESRIPFVAIIDQGDSQSPSELLAAGAASFLPFEQLEHELAPTVHTVLTLAHVRRTDDQVLSQVRSAEWNFEFASDERHIGVMVEFAQRILVTAGGCEATDALRACIALEESLRNALFHGNLELSSKDRDETPAEYDRLLYARQHTAPYQERKVRLAISVSQEGTRFVVTDEGPGFDPKTVPDPTDPDRVDLCGGRGVLLMRTFMDEVEFSPRGNEVVMFKRRS